MSVLCVVPTYVRSDEEVAVTVRTLETLREQEPEVDVLVVDDGSPMPRGIVAIGEACDKLGMELFEAEDNRGFSASVNVGLEAALERGQDAILANADMEFIMPFVEKFVETRDSQDRPAAVVGALLLYPNHLIQHGGVFLSFYTRSFDHRFRYGPASLPEAHQPIALPVTGALQFVRRSTLESIGIYDDDFPLAFEDVDYCLRVFDADLECVYQPSVRAIHHESLFRDKKDDQRLIDRQRRSLDYLYEKHGQTPLGRYILPIA